MVVLVVGTETPGWRGNKGIKCGWEGLRPDSVVVGSIHKDNEALFICTLNGDGEGEVEERGRRIIRYLTEIVDFFFIQCFFSTV